MHESRFYQVLSLLQTATGVIVFADAKGAV